MQDVAGKVAFITGGASGLGLAMAKSFTGAGMRVVIADIEESALAAAMESFGDTNADIMPMRVDVTSRDAMENAAQETLDAFGKVHVLCNNAGVAMTGNIADHTYADWDWLMRVNVEGVVNGVVSFINHIKSHGEGGHVVNTASMAGQVGMGNLSVYNTSKFAVVGMSEAMRQDLEPAGIGVSVLCPGFVATNIYTSERNRPNDFGGTDASEFAIGNSAEEKAAARQQILETALPAELIGDMVLHAIQVNEFYIFSHPELKDAVVMRGQAISDAFDRWAAWRQEQGA